ncbi:NucA/NucB deoxyribonuclease domain-containing protein [Streptomyces decoyicus]
MVPFLPWQMSRASLWRDSWTVSCSKKRKANRATAISARLKEWPEYAKQGKDCDEYPFSTTGEGA